MFRNLTILAAALAFFIVVLGAYVRLNDAGLGCPDWPGCYGHLTVPDEAHELEKARSNFPTKPVETKKAWIEMVHRYFATGLGFIILVLAVMAWGAASRAGSRALPSLLVAVVIFQGMLGMWTVTLLLKPAVVTAHLIGGMTTLSLLVWLALRQFRGRDEPRIIAPVGLRVAAAIGLAVLAVQIVLGGWVSTNYAALACTDFPRCQQSWTPAMDFGNAFHVVRELGMTARGEQLSGEALTAIHWMHRVGALVTASYLLGLVVWMLAAGRENGLAAALAVALIAQAAMGIANVLLSLPLHLAVAHNAGAALLLVLLVMTNYRLARGAQTRKIKTT